MIARIPNTYQIGKCEGAFQRPAVMTSLSTATAEANVAAKKNSHLNMIANAFILPPKCCLNSKAKQHNLKEFLPGSLPHGERFRTTDEIAAGKIASLQPPAITLVLRPTARLKADSWHSIMSG
jgi:hypothetical protein